MDAAHGQWVVAITTATVVKPLPPILLPGGEQPITRRNIQPAFRLPVLLASFILIVCLKAVDPIRSREFFHAETYISTQPAQTLEKARVPHPNEDQERGQGAVAPPGQGTQARLR